jgi:hypothetical protein
VEPIETVFHGPVPDQAALHGLLRRIEALGLELVEVRRFPSAELDGNNKKRAAARTVRGQSSSS